MADIEGHQILQAIEKQGERAERLSRDQMSVIQGLASEIRDFGQNVSKAVKHGPVNGNGRTVLFGVGAMIFGLMTPLYIMISGISSNLSRHENLEGHPATAAAMAGILVHNQEIETQFRGVSDRIDTMIKQMDRDDDREERDITGAAIHGERIRALEREIWGVAGPIHPHNSTRMRSDTRSAKRSAEAG